MNFKKLHSIIVLITLVLSVQAQEETSLLDMVEEEAASKEYVTAAFKTTRVVNAHSIENTAKGVLDFKIQHRFGRLNGGAYELFGLDQASVRMGLEYGISDRLMIGVARSTFEKTFDGFVKYKIIRQSVGDKSMPLSVTWVSGSSINSLKWANPNRENYFSSRVAYFHQMLIASKLSDKTTIQFMPTLVHRNLVETRAEANSVIAFGGAARQKLTSRIAINAEYFYALENQLAPQNLQSFSIGLDIETGGHVFQLHVTNSLAMYERGFITQTTGDWMKGDIHFGFNISRVFTLVKPKEFRNKK